ncbi:unnamed protein product [Tilletia controversa]|uniref:Secreted protein n=1 Tax=Tilletia controversa TaxID=13291 RepID=A0A8X7MK42_9BASI|nr:hypothetical protein CF328_g2510 [Tilletia controversa]KAE8238892.1 hypothetical protein A4X06_0g8589 [Tilletia controversa]CAD6915976.1 unnamed protein product [Tilletia controversa]CAD6958905.1 unnamed protein product [Tilletia controversa]CAD6970853.1 unnamed protein product [Tilletia controversa]
MRLATFSFLAAIFTAAVADNHLPRVNSYARFVANSAGWEGCYSTTKCSDGSVSSATYQCLHQHWAGLSRNKKCPYPDIGCLCYNGCVAEMWRAEINYDYGAECRDWCRAGTRNDKC